jgi:D-inositol-3-phosphate glycosyltransferase
MNVYIRELSRELGRRCHGVDIFTRRVDAAAPDVVDLDPNTRIIHVAAGPPSDGKESLRRHLPQFLRGVLSFQERTDATYDLIHSHYWLSGWVGQALQERWRVPHIIMFHTLAEAKNRAHALQREPRYRIEAEGQIAASADRVICASEGETELLVAEYGVPAERIEVVPCGVDLDLFRPMNQRYARRRLDLPVDESTVLFVGRIEPLKGIDILLRAVAQMDSHLCLLVVGGDEQDAPLKAGLRSLAAALGIAKQVQFVDAVPHQRLPLYYTAADVCVIPSHYESFGLVALEAMACGVPVVASRVGGLQDTVRDGETGYLVPWQFPGPFAERLALLLGNPELRRSLGLIARSAVERFRWSDVAAQVEAIYHELVGHHRGAAVGSHSDNRC